MWTVEIMVTFMKICMQAIKVLALQSNEVLAEEHLKEAFLFDSLSAGLARDWDGVRKRPSGGLTDLKLSGWMMCRSCVC
jgi:hypothetical protein